MFTRHLSAFAAGSFLALSGPSAELQQPTADLLPHRRTVQPERTLEAAIQNVSTRVVAIDMERQEIRPFRPENSAQAQALYDRWARYTREVKAASNEGSEPHSLQQAQREFVAWVKSELAKAGLTIPSENAALVGEYAELGDHVRYLRVGLRALAYHYGMVPDGCPLEVKRDPANPDSYFLVVGAPIRLYRVLEVNPQPWTKAFPDFAKDGIQLAAISFMSGRDYARGVDGRIRDKCAFMSEGVVFIDLTAVESLTESLKAQTDGHVRNWVTLLDLPPAEFIAKAASDRSLLPEPALDLVTRIKNGGAAYDCLVALAGTDRRTHEFSWDAVTGQRVGEYLSHEGRHAWEALPSQPRDRLLSRLARGGVVAPAADQSEAETLLEVGARLESMKHSLTYLFELVNDRRAGYDFGRDFKGQAARAAQIEIFQAIEAELRENPRRWGIEYSDKTTRIGGIELTPAEQILAQFHRFARSNESTIEMVDAVRARLRVEERKDELARKYGYERVELQTEVKKEK